MASRFPVMHTCFSRSWGGLEIQALEMTAHLQNRGWPISLACPPGSRLEEEAARRRVPVIPLDVRGYVHPLLSRRLALRIRHDGIRIVHAQHSKDLATVVPAAGQARTRPAVILSKRVGSYLMKRDVLHRYTFSRVARVLAISEVIRRNVIDTSPIAPERVVTLHDAIDTEEFKPGVGRGVAVRREFGLTDAHVVIGTVGRFSPGKGHEELLAAASTVCAARPAVRFLIVGEASRGEERYAESIRHMASALGLDGRLIFAGFRNDVPDVMAAFDIFAFPSHAEAFGVVLIEAMAMERAVVSTDCDGVLDIVVDGETGIMVPREHADRLASALLVLVDDPRLRGTMGAAGRRRVLDLFDRSGQMERLERLYEELVQAG
jgi:glycosyltransferase involved in cell wall biosynthesis